MIQFALIAAVCLALYTSSGLAQPSSYDLVLANGQVMDPESGLNAVRYVGIRDERIAAISAEPLEGKEIIDVGGLIVAPGFIDLHAHGQDLFSSRLQAQDGVTTALELEIGVLPVAAWYAEREGKAVINYGATVSHKSARFAALQDTDAAVYDSATPEQITMMQDLIRQGLQEGALGIGYGIQYTPGASREEILRMFEVAAEHEITNFVHIRYAGLVEPGSSIEAVQEMLANAAATGASVHIMHIGSSGLGQVPVLLDIIEGAQQHGFDVTTEVYPYAAASTNIKAAIFDPGWRERIGADYRDIEWVATGERLTKETFERYRKQGGMIIAHVIPEAMVELAIAHPIVMIASDGGTFRGGRAHPRGAGTFARVLGRYVREKRSLTLMQALRKMTLMPARRLEEDVPPMRSKGRLKVGADADITIFDASVVIDRATFQEPAQASAGIAHVLVGGTFVVRDGNLVEDVYPGKAIRRDAENSHAKE